MGWIANLLSLSRLVLAPLNLKFVYEKKLLKAFSLFLLLASTDFLDGRVARSIGKVTLLGKILDPLADKVLMNLTFYGFTFYLRLMPPWFFFANLFKDVAIATGWFILWCNHKVAPAPILIGKILTFGEALLATLIYGASLKNAHLVRGASLKLFFLAFAILMIVTLYAYFSDYMLKPPQNSKVAHEER